MRAIAIQDRFGVERLTAVERPEPRPGPGQALVRIRAVSLNYRDLLVVRGLYNPRLPLPLVPCSDGAGEVVAVGSGVVRVKPGDRVATVFAPKWISGEPTRDKLRATLGGPLDGTLTEAIALDAEGLVLVPAHLDHEQAATLPCAAVTAWSALTVHARIGPGDVLLVQGTGGVSVFALQLARLWGARVIVTSKSDEKLERARALGAWQTINYRTTPDWGAAAKRMAGGEGVDLVLDVGGAGTLEQALQAVRPGGQISQIGMLAGASAPLGVIPIHMRQLRIQGVFVGHRETFETLNRAIAAHALLPVIDRTFAFDDARAAFEQLERGEHFGKIVIRVG